MAGWRSKAACGASKGFEAEGELRFIGARLGGNVTLAGAKLSNPGGIAVNLDRATLSDLDCAGLEVREGQISLANTQVANQVTLTGAHLTATPGQPALTAAACPRLAYWPGDLRSMVAAKGERRWECR